MGTGTAVEVPPKSQTEQLRRGIEHAISKYRAALMLSGLGNVLNDLQAWTAQVDARLKLLEARAREDGR